MRGIRINLRKRFSEIRRRPACFLALIIFVFSTVALQAAPRVALMNFTSQIETYRNIQSAADFSAALQATASSGQSPVEWVERNQWQSAAQELKLSYFDGSVQDALRIGKWIKADLLVVGQFQADQKPVWELKIEVIDLDHADVLAERRIDLDVQTNEVIQATSQILERSAQALTNALADAEVQRERLQTQVKIAPLFFGNIGNSSRLDFFESDIIKGFETSVSDMPNLHVLRLPRAQEATGEAELIIGGLVESDPAAWQHVADIYIWGSYAEQDAPGLPFEKVPVVVTWYVWDGQNDPQTFSETVLVKDLPKLVPKITQSGIKAAQSLHDHVSINDETRAHVAGLLLKRANEINDRFDNAPSSYATPQGRIDWRYQANSLDVARFFDPGNQQIQEQALVRHWAPLWATPAPPWFRTDPLTQDRCASDYEEYVEKFGLTNNGAFDPRLARSYVEGLRGAISELDACANDPAWQANWPADATQAWQGRLETNYLQRLQLCDQAYIHATKFGPHDWQIETEWAADVYPDVWDFAWHKVHNAATRAAIFEEVWATAPSWLADDWYVDSLKRTYAEIDEPEKGQQLVDQLLTLVRKRRSPPQSQRPVMLDLSIPPVDVLPPPLIPSSMQPIDLAGENPQGIVALQYVGNQLWISSQSIDGNRHSQDMFSTPAGLGVPEALFPELTSPAQANLMVFDPSSQKTIDWTSRLQIHSKITSIVSRDDGLWLTSQGDGILRINPKSGEVQHFGGREGVATPELYAGANAGSSTVFGGGNTTDGHLSVFQIGSARWTEEKPVTPLKQVTSISSVGQRVLVVCQDYDGSPALVKDVQVLLSDDGRHFWKDVAQSLLADSPRGWQGREMIVSSADNRGFWLGAGSGLFFVSADGQTIKKWFTPPGNIARPSTRLRGAVTALAQDGDFLWIATTADWDKYLFHRPGYPPNYFLPDKENYVFLMHKPSGRWLGRFSVPSRVSALAVSADQLWVGLANPEDGRSLFQVDKRPLLQTPPDRWVSDDVSDEELYRQIAKLGVIEQARYYFLLGDTQKVLEVLKRPTDADYAGQVKQLIQICSGQPGVALAKTGIQAAPDAASSPNIPFELREAIRDDDMEKARALFLLIHNENDLNLALCVAASWGKIDAVKFLLAEGLNVNVHLHVQGDWDGGTPLTEAAANGRTDTIRELIAHGAQLEAADNQGNTALHNAARYGNVKTVALLLEKGSSINAQKKDGWTPLMLAARSGSIATAKLLLDNGAALSLENEEGDTALAIATNDHRTKMVALLKR